MSRQTSRPTQKAQAERFAALHHGPGILVLANAWDAASARMFEVAGARAVATTSAGCANALGYRDGEAMPLDDLLFLVRRIVATVDIPVTVDLETGFGATPADVAKSVTAVLDAGGVGINIEDADQPPASLVARIEEIREVAARRDVPLFVNARTDVYLRGLVAPEKRYDETIRRLRAYQKAGADGLFVPGLVEAATIKRLTADVDRPVNVLAFAGVPPAGELERLGVARVSVGSGPMRATMSLTQRIGAEIFGPGTWETFTKDVISHGEANQLFAP
jgi:2-methylisocitrate lyase-like PEP mutase family enzyme